MELTLTQVVPATWEVEVEVKLSTLYWTPKRAFLCPDKPKLQVIRVVVAMQGVHLKLAILYWTPQQAFLCPDKPKLQVAQAVSAEPTATEMEAVEVMDARAEVIVMLLLPRSSRSPPQNTV